MSRVDDLVRRIAATHADTTRVAPQPTPRSCRAACPACGTPMLAIGHGEWHCRACLVIAERKDDLTWHLYRR